MKEFNTAVPVSLPSAEEIKAIERKCENERSKVIGSVLLAPFIALRDLLDYRGSAETVNQNTLGAVAQ